MKRRKYNSKGLRKKEKIDIICIWELDRYRKINGFSHYEHCCKGTQSAIFWRKGMKIQVIKTTFNEKCEEILTQCILIAEEILLIHPYIPPRVSRHDRKTYWRDMQAFTDSWSLNNPSYKIVISGDLNTREIRFGESHSESHTYMDRFLADLEIICDKRVPIREGNTLDVTLGNLQAKNCLVRWKVIEKLSCDHSRIFTVMDV